MINIAIAEDQPDEVLHWYDERGPRPNGWGGFSEDKIAEAVVRTLLTSLPDTEVAGEGGAGEEAVALAASNRPDVVLMDIQMPGLNGIEATGRITQSHPDVAVVMLTMFEDDDSVFAAMRAGALGYLLKGADQAKISRAVRAAASGEAIFGPAIATRLISYFASGKPTPPSAFPELTEREREVLTLIAQGMNNTDIAGRLYLSPKTVRNHVSNILGKLQMADRVQPALLTSRLLKNPVLA